MLVLSRKLGERIRIGDVWVTVVDIDRGKIRLGIDAPASVVISREELLPHHLQYHPQERRGSDGQSERPPQA